MKKFFIILSLLLTWRTGFTQTDTTKSLLNETMLHPADAFTGYVFKKGEFSYNQALTPYPSWAWWGITNRITAELDFEAWLGGIPSFNFRIGLLQQKPAGLALAFETMFQYLKDERDQFDNLEYLNIKRQGSAWYNHINMSCKLGNSWYVHLSSGITYAENLQISNGDSLKYTGNDFNDIISPDFSFAAGWRLGERMSFHSSVSYGSTFLYADNIPRKQQFVFATRIAPFVNSQTGFLKHFRFELAYLYVYFKDADRRISGPIGFLYWQWE